jgi:hypothetical protein
MAHSPDIIMTDVNNNQTGTFHSISPQPQNSANNVAVPIPTWPNDTDLGDMNAGLYQLNPTIGDETIYNIVLYMEAFSFFDLYGFQAATDEIKKITDCFVKVIPRVFPNASVHLLWSRTMSDFSPTVEEKMKVSSSSLGSLNDKEHISRKPSVYIVMSPNYVSEVLLMETDKLVRPEMVQSMVRS